MLCVDFSFLTEGFPVGRLAHGALYTFLPKLEIDRSLFTQAGVDVDRRSLKCVVVSIACGGLSNRLVYTDLLHFLNAVIYSIHCQVTSRKCGK